MRYLLRSIIFFAFAVTALLSGCNSQSMRSDDAEFVKLLKDPSVVDINKTITMKRAVVYGSSPTRGILSFSAVNQSNNHLWFSPSSNVQIFVYNEDKKKWTEIPNVVQYAGDGVSIDPKGGRLDENLVEIIPAYEKNGKTQQLRVAVTGYIVKDGKTTKEPVSAYIDVNIK